MMVSFSKQARKCL